MEADMLGLRERCEDAMLLVLTMEEGGIHQGTQVASQAGKGKETEAPLEPPEGMHPC